MASAALGAAGAVALYSNRLPALSAFAVIPLIFSVQQLAEGFVWLALTRPGFFIGPEIQTYTFLFLALVVWPVWIPYSVWLQEKENNRKPLLLLLLLSGCVVACIMIYGLLFYEVAAETSPWHLHYALGFNHILVGHKSLIYFIPTVIPPFVASNKKLRLFGIGLLISYAVARGMYPAYVISVWCLFAALISIVIIRIVSGHHWFANAAGRKN